MFGAGLEADEVQDVAEGWNEMIFRAPPAQTIQDSMILCSVPPGFSPAQTLALLGAPRGSLVPFAAPASPGQWLGSNPAPCGAIQDRPVAACAQEWL